MFCSICKNDLVDCTCNDLEERLSKLDKVPNFVYRKCFNCNKHYSQCVCENPKWGINKGDLK